MPATDPLAHERFRTTLADAIGDTGYDAYAAGSDADPDVSAGKVLDAFPEAHFEYRINDAGVGMRRVVAVGTWEIDLVQPGTPDHARKSSPPRYEFCWAPMRQGQSNCHLGKGHDGRHRASYPC